jgi:hypothetical protein
MPGNRLYEVQIRPFEQNGKGKKETDQNREREKE